MDSYYVIHDCKILFYEESRLIVVQSWFYNTYVDLIVPDEDITYGIYNMNYNSLQILP